MEFSFEDFKIRALDNNLSKWEKIGFPDSYRNGKEQDLFQDIRVKLDLEKSDFILDIGCGCSDLVTSLINFCRNENKKLYLLDSGEMLSNIDNNLFYESVTLIPGKFPETDVKNKLSAFRFDSIIVYSVIQYIYNEGNLFKFIHECVNYLNPGGKLLIGDIPNFESRKRFLESEEGIQFISNFDKSLNTIGLSHKDEERIDDSIVMSILLRFRKFGCETYLLPQPNTLPFANRREDILIIKR